MTGNNHNQQQDPLRDKPGWLLNSWAWRKARGLVDATLASPKKLASLIDRAAAMEVLRSNSRFAQIAESVKASLRMLRAWASGDYREVSLETIGLVVASLIYFVMPFDVVPDFIIALGFADDAALLAWTLRAVTQDLERFMRWEAGASVEPGASSDTIPPTTSSPRIIEGQASHPDDTRPAE